MNYGQSNIEQWTNQVFVPKDEFCLAERYRQEYPTVFWAKYLNKYKLTIIWLDLWKPFQIVTR